MSTETEGTFAVQGATLYTKTWTPEGPVKAKLIFVHGYSDHLGRYYGLFPYLASRGIQVFGFDQRGWGRSVHKPSDKGLTGPTSQVIADVVAFIKDKLPSPDVPVFVMGHSMGGGEVLTMISDPQYDDLVAQIRGFVLESPFIAFPVGEEPGNLKIMVGKLVGRLLPHFQLVNSLPAEYFSRDPAVVQSVRDDKLCHNTGTLEGLAGLIERTENLQHGKAKLSGKVRHLLVCHGDADRTTNYAASKSWYEAQKIEDSRFKSYEGCYHQLHSDLCKDEFYKDVADWVLERSDAQEPKESKPQKEQAAKL